MTLLRQAYRRMRRWNTRAIKRQLGQAREQLLRSPDMSGDDRDLLSRTSLAIDPVDTMYADGEAFHYLAVGLSASRCVREALERAGKSSGVESVLDFPAGYGRGLRFLRAMFPDAAVTAAEIDRRALTFCRRAFGATPLLSGGNLDDLTIDRRFDLIWCGSLLTHLDERDGAALLRFFHRHLSDRGVCVVTTHGRHPVEAMASGRAPYALTDAGRRRVIEGFESVGFGYSDYPGQSGYGVSAVSHARMLELAASTGDWHEVLFIEQGWDHHQDVYAFVSRKP